MRIDQELVEDYLGHCRDEVRLDPKTIRAYRCDLDQFVMWAHGAQLCRGSIRAYVARLNKHYSQRTVRRKIASLKAFAAYRSGESQSEDIQVVNPFDTLRLSIREPKRLPRTIPYEDVRRMLSHSGLANADDAERRTANRGDLISDDDMRTLRDQVIIELLISTGIRVSELCGLDRSDCDLAGRVLRIFGKGAKERVVQLESEATTDLLARYLRALDIKWAARQPLFLNRFGKRLSDQSVRNIVARSAESVGIETHITPHMFRHTFATVLLEEGVDIRYIQSVLGHSSIKTTEIYTHVASAKQREALRLHNPRMVIAAGCS